MITLNAFKEVEMRVGEVVEAENQEGSEKLIRLKVDAGEGDLRTIFTGVRPFGYGPEDFLGKRFLFVTNLEPKGMMGEESQGMILAVDGAGDKPVFVEASAEMPVGAKVR